MHKKIGGRHSNSVLTTLHCAWISPSRYIKLLALARMSSIRHELDLDHKFNTMFIKTVYSFAFLYLLGANAFPTLSDGEPDEISIAELDSDLE